MEFHPSITYIQGFVTVPSPSSETQNKVNVSKTCPSGAPFTNMFNFILSMDK